jgi:hypothetical protein
MGDISSTRNITIQKMGTVHTWLKVSLCLKWLGNLNATAKGCTWRCHPTGAAKAIAYTIRLNMLEHCDTDISGNFSRREIQLRSQWCPGYGRMC